MEAAASSVFACKKPYCFSSHRVNETVGKWRLTIKALLKVII